MDHRLMVCFEQTRPETKEIYFHLLLLLSNVDARDNKMKKKILSIRHTQKVFQFIAITFSFANISVDGQC